MSAVAWRCSIHLERSCWIVFQLNKPEFSAHFRHSLSVAWVCLFAVGGGGGICEIIEFQTSWILYSIGFGTDGDLPDGYLFSVWVWFAFALT